MKTIGKILIPVLLLAGTATLANAGDREAMSFKGVALLASYGPANYSIDAVARDSRANLELPADVAARFEESFRELTSVLQTGQKKSPSLASAKGSPSINRDQYGKSQDSGFDGMSVQVVEETE